MPSPSEASPSHPAVVQLLANLLDTVCAVQPSPAPASTPSALTTVVDLDASDSNPTPPQTTLAPPTLTSADSVVVVDPDVAIQPLPDQPPPSSTPRRRVVDIDNLLNSSGDDSPSFNLPSHTAYQPPSTFTTVPGTENAIDVDAMQQLPPFSSLSHQPNATSDTLMPDVIIPDKPSASLTPVNAVVDVNGADDAMVSSVPSADNNFPSKSAQPASTTASTKHLLHGKNGATGPTPSSVSTPAPIQTVDIDDDDDDIQIVSAAIVHPPTVHPTPTVKATPSEPILLDDDDNNVDEIDEIEKVYPTAQPIASANLSTGVVHVSDGAAEEVVICSPVVSNVHRSEARELKICAVCRSRVRNDRQPLSRCKHTLCTNCMLRCLLPSDVKAEAPVDGKSSVQLDVKSDAQLDVMSDVQSDVKSDAQPGAETDANHDVKSDVKPDDMSDATPIPDDGKSSKRPTTRSTSKKISKKSCSAKEGATSASTRKRNAAKAGKKNSEPPSSSSLPAVNCLSNLPACVTPRCAAPLSRAEVFTALAPKQVDEMFAGNAQKFLQWTEAAASSTDFGHSHIQFPTYDPESMPFTFSNEQSTEKDYNESLLTDDFQSAYSALWAWDNEYVNNGRRGVWLCLACGKHNVSPLQAPSPPPNSSEAAPVASVSIPLDSAIPDPPLYPHCAYARAFAVLEHIKGLTDVRDGMAEAGGEKSTTKRKRRSSSSKTSSRKRYTTATTVHSAKRRKVGFAKGTGYAGRSGGEWTGTSTKLLAEKTKVDNALTFWLLRVRCFLVMTPDAPLATWPGFMRKLLREQGMVGHLASVLINESIMDVAERIPVFLAALRVVHAICDCPSLRVLATDPSDGDNGKTIAELVDSLSRQAAVLSTGAGPDGMSKGTEVLIKQIRRCIRLINRHNLLDIAQEKAGGSSVAVDVDATENVLKEGKGGEEADAEKEIGGIKESDDPFEEDKAAYVKEMRNHQFETVQGLAQTSSFYQEALQSESTTAVPTGKRQRRIVSEVASLFSSLPLSWSSTILLRADEDRYDFLRAVIFGPEGTPYDSGAFVFDIWLPLEYPAVPPKFKLLTTGSGRVRFNPNLYNNGKVCLSLLGTWTGPSWTAASTILQVLVSIQSLILVSDPYFNEPGFERHMGTAEGNNMSESYNSRVRNDCAFHAIQYNVRHPSFDIEQGLRQHFLLKRRYIKHILGRWFPQALKELDELKDGDNASERTRMVSVDPTLSSGVPSDGQSNAQGMSMPPVNVNVTLTGSGSLSAGMMGPPPFAMASSSAAASFPSVAPQGSGTKPGSSSGIGELLSGASSSVAWTDALGAGGPSTLSSSKVHGILSTLFDPEGAVEPLILGTVKPSSHMPHPVNSTEASSSAMKEPSELGLVPASVKGTTKSTGETSTGSASGKNWSPLSAAKLLKKAKEEKLSNFKKMAAMSGGGTTTSTSNVKMVQNPMGMLKAMISPDMKPLVLSTETKETKKQRLKMAAMSGSVSAPATDFKVVENPTGMLKAMMSSGVHPMVLSTQSKALKEHLDHVKKMSAMSGGGTTKSTTNFKAMENQVEMLKAMMSSAVHPMVISNRGWRMNNMSAANLKSIFDDLDKLSQK